MLVISFKSTAHAIRAEKLFQKNNLKIMVMPTPSSITNACGISMEIKEDDVDKILEITKQNKLSIHGIYNVEKNNCTLYLEQ